MRNLLNEVGWRYPVLFGLRLEFAPDRWSPADWQRIRKLYQLASSVIGDPEPSNSRLLLFNLRETITVNNRSQLTIEALLDLFRLSDREEYSPFDIFKQLNQWQQKGLISDAVLIVLLMLHPIHPPDCVSQLQAIRQFQRDVLALACSQIQLPLRGYRKTLHKAFDHCSYGLRESFL